MGGGGGATLVDKVEQCKGILWRDIHPNAVAFERDLKNEHQWDILIEVDLKTNTNVELEKNTWTRKIK